MAPLNTKLYFVVDICIHGDERRISSIRCDKLEPDGDPPFRLAEFLQAIASFLRPGGGFHSLHVFHVLLARRFCGPRRSSPL